MATTNRMKTGASRGGAADLPRFPDSVFLCQKDLDTGEYECYKITKAADKITDGEESK